MINMVIICLIALRYYSSYCVKSEFTKKITIGPSLIKGVIDKNKIISGQFKNNIYSLSYRVKNDLDEDIDDHITFYTLMIKMI